MQGVIPLTRLVFRALPPSTLRYLEGRNDTVLNQGISTMVLLAGWRLDKGNVLRITRTINVLLVHVADTGPPSVPRFLSQAI